MVKLLPCPFCGAEAHFTPRIGSFSAVAGCANEDCKAQPEVLSMREDTAIAGWNTRAALSSEGSHQ